MKLSREEAIENHRKMWKWIAEETLKREKIVCKEEYLEEYFPDESIRSGCFCCEYGKQKTNSEENIEENIMCKWCKFCPLDWGSDCSTSQCMDKSFFNDNSNLFALFAKTSSWEEAAKLAKQIAELPERKDVE